MKKILIGLLFVFSISFLYLLPVSAESNCDFNTRDNPGEVMDSCLSDSTKLVKPVNGLGKLEIKTGFKDKILKWVENISIFFSIMAVGSIVYGAFMLTISIGEDEKIKKGKDIVKWGIIGFLAIISAGGLISIVINFVYSVAG